MPLFSLPSPLCHAFFSSLRPISDARPPNCVGCGVKATYSERWQALSKLLAMPVMKVVFNAQARHISSKYIRFRSLQQCAEFSSSYLPAVRKFPSRARTFRRRGKEASLENLRCALSPAHVVHFAGQITNSIGNYVNLVHTARLACLHHQVALMPFCVWARHSDSTVTAISCSPSRSGDSVNSSNVSSPPMSGGGSGVGSVSAPMSATVSPAAVLPATVTVCSLFDPRVAAWMTNTDSTDKSLELEALCLGRRVPRIDQSDGERSTLVLT